MKDMFNAAYPLNRPKGLNACISTLSQHMANGHLRWLGFAAIWLPNLNRKDHNWYGVFRVCLEDLFK